MQVYKYLNYQFVRTHRVFVTCREFGPLTRAFTSIALMKAQSNGPKAMHVTNTRGVPTNWSFKLFIHHTKFQDIYTWNTGMCGCFLRRKCTVYLITAACMQDQGLWPIRLSDTSINESSHWVRIIEHTFQRMPPWCLLAIKCVKIRMIKWCCNGSSLHIR